MNGQVIRDWANWYLVRNGIASSDVKRFLESVAGEHIITFLEHLYTIQHDEGSVHDLADFEAYTGGQLLCKAYDAWDRKRSSTKSCSTSVSGTQFYEGTNLHEYGFIPITEDMLPKRVAREAESFIRVYEAYLCERIDEYLRNLSRCVGIPATDRENILASFVDVLLSSRCVHAYTETELFETCDVQRIHSPEYEAFVEARHVLEGIISPYFSDFSVLQTPLFVYGEFPRDLYFTGRMFVSSVDSCDKCQACTILTGLHRLLTSLQENWLRYWYPSEAFEFILRGTSLPVKVGRIRSELPFEQNITVLYPASVRVSCYTPPRCHIELLPILPSETVAKIYDSLTHHVRPKEWAILYLELALNGSTKIGENHRRGFLKEMLKKWNKLVHSNWSITNNSSRNVLCRTLKNIRKKLEQAMKR